MPRPNDSVRVRLGDSTEPEVAALLPDADSVFRILVLGDFTGRSNRGLRNPREIADRHPLHVDRDNFDHVMRRLSPSLRLAISTDLAPLEIEFKDLWDFEPDALYRKLPLFRALHEARDVAPHPTSPQPRAPQRPGVEEIVSGSLLDTIVSESDAAGASAPGLRDPLQAYIDSLVAPYLEPKASSAAIQWKARVDEEISRRMRDILHHPHFQSLEGAWRGLHFLVRSVETGAHLKIFLLDVSLDELIEDLLSTDNLRATGLFQVLVEQTTGTPGAPAWAVLVGVYEFTPDILGANVLARMALLAGRAGAPFLAGARFPWPEETSEQWNLLRSIPEGAYIGLAAPRFLLRLPYGKETVSTEFFEFEEMPVGGVHQHYLWGCPSLFCAALFGGSFAERGWSLGSGLAQEMSGFPLHVYREGGDMQMKSPAEEWLTEERVTALLDAGLMPLVAFQNSDRIRLARFQSIQNPPLRLAGRW